MTKENLQAEKKYNKWIVALSVIIPLAVAALFGVNLRNLGFDVEPLSFLPPIYATVNGVTAVVLIAAFIAIKNKNIKLHERLMKTAIALSVAFLVMYVAYHMTSDSTRFGGEGAIKYAYYFILITHILLAIVITPLALITLYRGWTDQKSKHREIAKITFLVWLYVSVTGVVIYLMLY